MMKALLFSILILAFCGVLDAQKYCSYGLRYNRYCYSSWWWRYCWNTPQYYCKFNKNPASRPTATVRLGDEEWLADRVNGRPEVWYSNQWGTVCGLDSHGWTWADGELLCQQYGLSGRIEHGTVGDYGNINPGTGRVWLDYLTCSSYYDWISQCSHNGWGASSACTHDNDGAVSCRKQGIIRLDDGPDPLQGRIKYYHYGSWRKVCDDYWDNNDAIVACRQLGFGAPVTSIESSTVARIYGYDYSSSYWLDNLHCSGDEDSLTWCKRNSWGSEDCSYYEEVAINCSMPAPTILSATVKSSSQIDVTVSVDYALQFSTTITGYKIDFKAQNDNTFRFEEPETSDITYTYSITGLEPYTLYDLKASVKLEELPHRESFSSIMTRRTWMAKPGAVSGGWFQVTGSSTIRVYWSSVPEPNGIISRFSFRYWAKDPTWNHHSGVQFQDDPTAKQYILTGLNAYTTYAINVRPVNNAGEGENLRLVAQTWQAAPNAVPTDLRLTATTSSSITMSWSPPPAVNQRGVITYYAIRWRRGWSSYKQFNTDGPVLTYHFDNLDPNQVYRFRIAAATKAGIGPYIPWTAKTTLEAAPTGPPQGVSITTLSDTELKVTWRWPAWNKRNGVISGYVLHYGQSQSVFTTMELLPSQTSYTINGAEANTRYYVRVAARTSAGLGPFSSWVNSKTSVSAPTAPPEEIDVPEVDITTTSAKVTWRLPSDDADHNGVLTRSIIRVYPTGRYNLVGRYNPAVSDPDALQEYILPNLLPYTQYDVDIAVRNWRAIGPRSNRLTFRTLPSAPGAGPEISLVTADQSMPSVTVTWNALDMNFFNDDALTYYRVLYQPTDGSQNASTMDVAYPATTVTLTTLQEATAYVIRVAAVNHQGVGPYGDEETVVTSGQAPDDAPHNVRVWALSSTSVHVEWNPPSTEDHQLTITQYVVFYNKVGDSNIYQRTAPATTSDDRHTYDITGLDPYTDYVVVVHATNSAGRSPGSLPHPIRTASAGPLVSPVIVSLAENATEVTVTWSPITNMQARGIVTGYSIQYGPTGRPQDTAEIAAHVYTHDFLGLEPYTEYQFRVAVRNINGTGAYSSPMTVTTEEDVPTAPRIFRATAISSTAITLTWTIPANPNGELSYILNYTALHANIMDTEQFELTNGLQTTYNVTDLQENVEYEFFLWAKTEVGLSDPVIAQERTFEDVPVVPPVGVTAVTLSSMSVNVSWMPPPVIFRNGDLTGYSIRYWEVQDSIEEPDVYMMKMIDDPVILNYVIMDLTPYKTYGFGVAALNGAGAGPYSIDVLATTGTAAPPKPTGFKVTQTTNTSIFLSWDIPDHANGVFMGFKLKWWSTYPDGINMVDNVTLSSEDGMAEVGELYPGVEFQFMLVMYNDVGDSMEPAYMKAKTMPDLPSDSVMVTAAPLSSSSLQVAWTPPPVTSWNGLIEEIVIKYRDNQNPNASDMWYRMLVKDHATTDDLTMSQTMTSLDPFTPYQFEIALINEAGMGPYSEMAVALTLEDLPGKCVDFQVFVYYNTLNCTWGPPININGILVGYRIYLKSELYLTLTNLNNTLHILDLEPRQNYIVEIAALTSIGEGERSSVIVQTGDRPQLGPVAAPVSSYIYYIVAVVVIVVVCAVALVVVLGCIAYVRHKRAKQLKGTMGYAEDEDEWKLYSGNEDDLHTDGTMVTNPYSEEELTRRAKEREARLGTDVVGGLKGVGRKEITDEDVAAFDSALDKLRGVGDVDQ